VGEKSNNLCCSSELKMILSPIFLSTTGREGRVRNVIFSGGEIEKID